MKLKVLKIFRDKYTNERYEVGSIIEPTDKRAKELLAAKGELVEVVEGSVVKENLTTENEKPKNKKRK